MPERINNEVNDPSATPSVIEQFIGQDSVKRQVRVALEAAWQDGTKLPHMLMSGGPGLGKTQLSHILAKEMGAELYEHLSQNIQTIEQMRGALLEPQDRDVLLLDEIHTLDAQCQTCLYRALENGQVFLGNGKRKDQRILQTANFTVIAATTDPHRLLKPLRDRMKLVLHFDFYGDELSLLVKQRAMKLRWQVEDDRVFELIAQRGRGTPRIALRILESVRRVARSRGDDILTLEHLEVACELEGLDSVGLGHAERKYLCILAQYDAPVRLNVLASRIGLHPKVVTTTIEEFVLRAGFIVKTDKGRMISSEGLQHLQDNQSSERVYENER